MGTNEYPARPASASSGELSRRAFLGTVGVGAAAAAAGVPAAGAAAHAKRPNVLLIVCDDLGGHDLTCYGSSFYETPNIDRLAREGVRFTQSYAAGPVCSPTRASIQTGKYPARIGMTNWIGGSQHPTPYTTFLEPDEATLGGAFGAAGYRTGFIGKWHMGDEPENSPDMRGYGWMSGNGGAMPRFFSPFRNFWNQSEPPTINLDPGSPGDHLCDRLTDEALGFIGAEARAPFFLCLSYYDPHTPIEARGDKIEKYVLKLADAGRSEFPEYDPEPTGDTKTRRDQNHPIYAAMIENLDDNVGRLLDALDAQGLANDTIVMFTSDHGGLSTYDARPTSNAPHRAGKGWLYEGGIRVPLLVRAPGRVPAGVERDCPVISADLYPTLLTLAGLPLMPAQHRDGHCLSPVLTGQSDRVEREALYWHFPHEYPSHVPSSAIRKGSLKLIEFFREGRLELYDLAADPSETTNLVEDMPALTAELHAALVAWRHEVGAKLPVFESAEG